MPIRDIASILMPVRVWICGSNEYSVRFVFESVRFHAIFESNPCLQACIRYWTIFQIESNSQRWICYGISAANVDCHCEPAKSENKRLYVVVFDQFWMLLFSHFCCCYSDFSFICLFMLNKDVCESASVCSLSLLSPNNNAPSTETIRDLYVLCSSVHSGI